MTYDTACNLRTLAEQTRQQQLYQAAAAAFSELGMTAAAARMQDRAEHYEKEERHETETAEL